MDSFTESRYNMILGRDLLTASVLNLHYSKTVISGGDRPYEGCTALMDDIITYEFITSKECDLV